LTCPYVQHAPLDAVSSVLQLLERRRSSAPLPSSLTGCAGARTVVRTVGTTAVTAGTTAAIAVDRESEPTIHRVALSAIEVVPTGNRNRR
jgi:hypothetical protein